MAEQRAIAAAWTPSGIQVGAALAVALAGIAVLFARTFASLVDVWTQSGTFTHCFVIAPISLYLIWRRREELRRAPKKTSPAAIGVALVLSAAWLVAAIAEVQVGEQLAAVLLIPAAVVAVLGIEASRRIAFPLAFLIFAVPFGEALIPALMDFTASFTVGALRVTGIPVMREGFYFKIPSGDFEVAKACSGIRYLIACGTLGVLFAYLSFTSWRKRAIFIAVSIVAPIIANGVRAYLIVMIAHLSSMRLAVGVDHLIYGWLFFGALVALLFWAGGKFADHDVAPSLGAPDDSRSRESGKTATFATAGLIVVFAALGPYVLHVWQDGVPRSVRVPTLPLAVAGWQGPAATTGAWRHTTLRAGAVAADGRYTGPAGTVELTVLAFEPGTAEVVGSMGKLVDSARWQTLETGRAPSSDSLVLVPNELVLRSQHEYAVVWYWYVVGTKAVALDWEAKVVEGWRAIRDGHAESTLVALAASAADADAARATLSAYVATAMAPVDACAAGAVSGCAGR